MNRILKKLKSIGSIGSIAATVFTFLTFNWVTALAVILGFATSIFESIWGWIGRPSVYSAAGVALFFLWGVLAIKLLRKPKPTPPALDYGYGLLFLGYEIRAEEKPGQAGRQMRMHFQNASNHPMKIKVEELRLTMGGNLIPGHYPMTAIILPKGAVRSVVYSPDADFVRRYQVSKIFRRLLMRLIAILFSILSLLIPMLPVHGQSANPDDVEKITCKDAEDLLKKEGRILKELGEDHPELSELLIFKTTKTAYTLIWFIGHHSPSENDANLPAMLGILRMMGDDCKNNDNELLLKVLKEAAHEYHQLLKKDQSTAAFPTFSCREFAEWAQSKVIMLRWVVWFDGFLSKKNQFDFAKLENTIEKVFTRCRENPEQNILSLMKKTGQY
ncbi:MAG: hypothetical protein JNK86_04360 [Alphaproteobacteria bacterium]|nr:hypothetical protein [Alphaproteobacteria bacterium]